MSDAQQSHLQIGISTSSDGSTNVEDSKKESGGTLGDEMLSVLSDMGIDTALDDTECKIVCYD